MKVFKINDYDWWMAKDELTAVTGFTKLTGTHKDDVESVEEVSEIELEKFDYYVEYDEGKYKCEGTFLDQVKKNVSAGIESTLLASTER
tara:strand:- start:1437 stop:1703 length:267 start_codon:yes stop_codon:yes gene_type:complete